MVLPIAQDAPRLNRDLRLLAVFVEVYCRRSHGDSPRAPLTLKTHDVTAIAGHDVTVCTDCAKLLSHAIIKRSCCPMDPKPWCKHCPKHCYSPHYRERMREVMRVSGMALVLRGRLDYLLHFLF